MAASRTMRGWVAVWLGVWVGLLGAQAQVLDLEDWAPVPGVPTAWRLRAEVPGWWQGQRLELRAPSFPEGTQVLANGTFIAAESGEPGEEPVFDLTASLGPGMSILELRVPEGSNWKPHGIRLRAMPKTWIASVRFGGRREGADAFDTERRAGTDAPYRMEVKVRNRWAGSGEGSIAVRLVPEGSSESAPVVTARVETALGYGERWVTVPLWLSSRVPEGLYRMSVALRGTILDRGVDHEVVEVVTLRRDVTGDWQLTVVGPTPAIQERTPGSPGADTARRPRGGHERAVRSLAGRWRVRLDPQDAGLREGWFAHRLVGTSTVRLPGTTEAAGLGVAPEIDSREYPVDFPFTRFPGVQPTNRVDLLGFLVPQCLHLGPAWYERDIEVPDAWRDRWLRLSLERVIWRTDAWIDGVALESEGNADSLAAPHSYRVGRLSPGRHRLLIRVDNRMQVNLSTLTHAYGPETQGRWNGLVGRLELEAFPALALRKLDVYPAADRRSVRVSGVLFGEGGAAGEGTLSLALHRLEGERAGREILASVTAPVSGGSGERRQALELPLPQPAEPWDEFSPVLYRLVGTLRTGAGEVSGLDVDFGFRHLERDGRAIRINGRRIFLRGTLDCAVYPRTGHPPMTVAEWDRVLGVVKAHGFNHVRFHTWCPPEAAFAAADRLGLYLMPEVAAWVDDWTRGTWQSPAGIGRDATVNAFVTEEIRRISEAYGNHPSFAFFCIGNEFGMEGTDWPVVEGWMAEAKGRDPRRLYAGSTARRLLGSDDYWVTHSAHGKGTRGVGPARSDWDFSAAAAASEVPLIAHETGQRPVFPEYRDLLPKFTGALRPWNYERLREACVTAGVADQVRDFERASARFQAVLYKAEHEAMRRTAEYAGYQLLMLGDFTGQSEALVGILDPFGESKGVVTTRDVLAWNAVTVPLVRWPRYTWAASETLRAEIQVAHHGPRPLADSPVTWELGRPGGGAVRRSGRFDLRTIPTGTVQTVGVLDVPLGELGDGVRAEALELRVRCGTHENAWPLWVYPAGLQEAPSFPESVMVARRWDEVIERNLVGGGTVLLLTHGLVGAQAARTGFESVYWSAGWWGNRFSMLGVRCDPGHAALRDFPNAGHSDWQWETLVRGATTVRLERFPRGFRPIVQGVPDFHFPGMLAQAFEARVGKGRLLVCGYDLETDLARRHAARQFRGSLVRYLGSSAFRPRSEFRIEDLRAVLGDLKREGEVRR